ncbi:transcriptional regulator of RNA polII, SAGA, subunit-domain-containing protein [Protomyces lactucae-debilis]|uniref:Transcriptional regulator of RNA polII, SAGA, subunit-domain-containing protein n=1 Tax=Protomyces lactucae-debilis TaxID=2754530 RepID=A0A1Y2FL82_PROLT|nr:transcriptional regulator of RNA polII, SAGA, subunit-domain-containing protein [Protomyces lactucae-debilis]ORY84337.1 transcriptional regulator of RNA polII, SAGA, subunit-domain-containing protein [Protomyces lactucae-debilis]
MVDANRASPISSPVASPEESFGPDSASKARKTVSNGKATPAVASGADRSAAARVDIDVPLNKLHEVLKEKWSAYQQIVTDFLTARLTRNEFEQQLQPILVNGTIKLHNDIMLTLLSNAYKEPPPAIANSLGWSKKRREPPRMKGDPHAKRLKAEVMGLPTRERRRLKSIPKPEANAKTMPNSMIETRFAKLPRVPVSQQKINTSQHHNDILKGFHVPLAQESYQLPEPETLKDRILATALENGLLGGVSAQVPELILSALDIHLRNILTATIQKVRTNRGDAVWTHTREPIVLPPSLKNPGPSVIDELDEKSSQDAMARRRSSVKLEETTMAAHELHLAYNLAPHLFGENATPAVQRMVMLSLDDATPPDVSWQEIEEADIAAWKEAAKANAAAAATAAQHGLRHPSLDSPQTKSVTPANDTPPHPGVKDEDGKVKQAILNAGTGEFSQRARVAQMVDSFL